MGKVNYRDRYGKYSQRERQCLREQRRHSASKYRILEEVELQMIQIQEELIEDVQLGINLGRTQMHLTTITLPVVDNKGTVKKKPLRNARM